MNQVQQFFEYIINAVKIWVIIQPWQTGLRVRGGKKIKLLKKGIYFRIPYYDSIYVQEKRLRVIPLPMQNLTTKDGNNITTNGSIGYSITDIKKLYDTLYQPEKTVMNMAMSDLSQYVFENDLVDVDRKEIEERILEYLNNCDYGLKFEFFRLENYSVARTYRLITDKFWDYEGLDMEKKK